MKRRKFLIGAGSTAIGGSALLGTGAFTRVESHRRAKIQVAHDSDAYLGLDGCPDSPNASYTNIDSDGHLEIDMSPGNPTGAGGEGVNSNSRSYFDSVFQVCNNGKQEVCVWIRDDENWPRVPENYADAGDRRVDFYLEDDPGRSIIGPENRLVVGVGECACIGVRTNTKGLSKGDQLLDKLDDRIKLIADEDCPPEVPPKERGKIRGEKRLTDELSEYIEGLENTEVFDPQNPRAGWEIQLFPDPGLEQQPRTTTTDENGQYYFTDLVPGSYTVCGVEKPGSFQVFPADAACYEVEVGAGETVKKIDFENDLAPIENGVVDDPRTIGFWSNWSGDCTPGGQDNVLGETLQSAEDRDETITLGELEITAAGFATPPDDCGAVNLLLKRDLDGSVRAADGAYALAAQLLAAKLNREAIGEVPGDGTGTPGEDCEDVQAQIAAGQALLAEEEFDGTGSYLPPNTPSRQEALAIAACLDRYNNGEFT